MILGLHEPPSQREETKVSHLLSGLKDTRNPERITYSFELLMISALCAIMAGEDNFTGIADYLEVNREIFSKYFLSVDP